MSIIFYQPWISSFLLYLIQISTEFQTHLMIVSNIIAQTSTLQFSRTAPLPLDEDHKRNDIRNAKACCSDIPGSDNYIVCTGWALEVQFLKSFKVFLSTKRFHSKSTTRTIYFAYANKV